MKIVIETDLEQSLKIEPEKAISLEDLMWVLFNAQLSILKAGAKDQSKEVAYQLWDMYNVAASNTLTAFIPDKELRPDLTQEALKDLLEVENKYMKKAVASVKKGAKKWPKSKKK